jgi:hypothetical protein
VFSILWRLIRPGALALAAQSVLLALTVFRPGHHAPHNSAMAHPTFLFVVVKAVWFGSIVGAPGVSLLDAAIYFATAYRGVQRTHLVKTGVIAAATTSVVGFVVLFAAAAMITPNLAIALLAQPSLLLILSAYLAIPLAYSILIGSLGGTISRLSPPRPRQIAHSS